MQSESACYFSNYILKMDFFSLNVIKKISVKEKALNICFDNVD